jgi:macrolide-specific efflux system membrane fusion protein
MARQRPIPIILWIIILAVLFISGCSAEPENNGPTPMPPLEIVQPAEYVVEQGTVHRTLTFNGRVASVLSQSVFFEDDGVVTGVLFQQGDVVSEGDVIAHLSIADLEHQKIMAELTQQAAELQTNQADLVAAEIALNQAETEEEHRLAEAQLADAQNQAQAREIEIQLLQEEVNRLEAEISRRQVAAPFDGILQVLDVRPGDSVAAFASIATIADLSDLEVVAEVSPAVASVLGIGQEVTVTLPASELSYSGLIEQLPTFGIAGNNLVHISLPDTTEATSGELASIFVILEEKRDVLTLPPAAIRKFQGRTFVLVAEPDGTRRRFDVLLGLQSDTLVEIVDGLTVGQTVIGE